MKKTKVIATIGPACDSIEKLVQMVKAGMNVARINLSHGTWEEHKAKIEKINKVKKLTGLPLAIMLDTRGPELRLGVLENGKAILKSGDLFTLTTKNVVGNNKIATINQPKSLSLLKPNDKVLACNALVTFKVLENNGKEVTLKVIDGGEIGSKKSLSFPGKHFNFPYLNDADKDDILRGLKEDVEYIACSFVNSKEDILKVKKFVEENGGNVKLISKIESSLGVDNIDEIINASDGIMVARGDLGVELPFEKIPHLQKLIIKKCVNENKIVITATEMLESMITSSRPTRAETSDVANAVFDGSSAVMLSGESAMGKYPVEAVKTMAKILEETEDFVDYDKLFVENENGNSIADIMSNMVASLAYKIKGLKAVCVYTNSGHTAQMISKHFPSCPILALTPNKKTFNQLSAVWGVYPVLTKDIKTADKLIVEIEKVVKAKGFANKGDMILIGTGTRQPSSTDIIKLHIL